MATMSTTVASNNITVSSTVSNTINSTISSRTIGNCTESMVLQAAGMGNVELLDDCVRQRQSVPLNITSTVEKETLAHLGAKNDRLKVVEWCLTQHRDFFLYSRDIMNNTLLHVAITGNGSKIMVDYIVAQNASILYEKNVKDWTGLDEATNLGRKDIVVRLVDVHHINLTRSTTTLLAAEKGQEAILTFLLEREPRLANLDDGCNSSLLHRTVEYRLKNVTELLCRKYHVENRTNCGGDFPMNVALRLLSFDIADLLKEDCGADYLQPKSIAPHDTSVHEAAQDGVTAILRHLDDEDPYLYNRYQNMTNDRGEIPIMLAANNSHIDTVKYLLERGAHNYMNFEDNKGNVVLHRTACNPSLTVVKFLFLSVSASIEVNKRNKEGKTSVFVAIECENLPFIEYLVKKNANLSIPTYDFRSALTIAVQRDSLNMVEYLLKNRPQAENFQPDIYNHIAPDYSKSEKMSNFFQVRFPNITIRSAYNTTEKRYHCQHFSVDFVEHGNIDFMKYCVNKEYSLLKITSEPKRESLVHRAAHSGRLDVIQWLLEDNFTYFVACVDTKHNTILHAAAFGGFPDIVEYIARKTNSREFFLKENADGFNALHVAAAQGHKSAAEVLVDSWQMSPGIRTSSKNDTAALVAAKNGHDDIVLWFIKKEPSIASAVGECESNVLNLIADHVAPRIAIALCKKYAVQGRSNCKGDYPIHVAYRTNVLQAGVLADACDEDLLQERTIPPRNTPAHEAAITGRLDILKFLDDKHKDGPNGYPEMKNDEGQTPIFLAIRNNQFNITKFLVGDKRVRLDKIDKEGNTIVHETAGHSDLNIIKYLQEQWLDGLRSSLTKRNYKGETIYYKAASSNNLQLVEYLANFTDIDIDIPAYDNTTAFGVAIKENYFGIVKFISTSPNKRLQRLERPWEYANTEEMRVFLRNSFDVKTNLEKPKTVSKREITRLGSSDESYIASVVLDIAFLNITILLLDTIVKKVFGRKSNNGSVLSDLPLSPPEVVRSKMDPIALEAIYQDDQYESLDEDDQ